MKKKANRVEAKKLEAKIALDAKKELEAKNT